MVRVQCCLCSGRTAADVNTACQDLKPAVAFVDAAIRTQRHLAAAARTTALRLQQCTGAQQTIIWPSVASLPATLGTRMISTGAGRFHNTITPSVSRGVWRPDVKEGHGETARWAAGNISTSL